jgi:putative membrane protein
MTDRADLRRPAAFRLDDPKVVMTAAEDEGARLPRAAIRVIEEAAPAALPVAIGMPDLPSKRRFRWGALFWGSLSGLLALGAGLSATRLIEDLFARDTTLGVVGLVFAAGAAFALLVLAARETLALTRLAAVEKLHLRATEALASDDRAAGRAVARDLIDLTRANPHLARARALLQGHERDIIDGADFVRLAERELMAPLDREARNLIRGAAQRVSVVTAVSPRAVVDILFVAINALRLVRQLAYLYGGRPGALGMIRLMRQTVAHLAVTGGVAASDSLIQQVLGHGVAAKLSSRLGEGVLNGLLTARLGLAAVDVTRPLPFTALPRPVLADLARDMLRGQDVPVAKAD